MNTWLILIIDPGCKDVAEMKILTYTSRKALFLQNQQLIKVSSSTLDKFDWKGVYDSHVQQKRSDGYRFIIKRSYSANTRQVQAKLVIDGGITQTKFSSHLKPVK